MEKAQNNLAQKFNSFGELLSHYFYGKTFPMLIGLFMLLCYTAKATFLALLVLSLLTAFVLLFYKNLAPIFPMLFMAVFSLRNFDDLANIGTLLSLSPVVLALLARPFLHPVKLSKPGIMFFPLIGVCLAWALGGILRPEHNFLFGLPQFLSLGVAMLVIYLLFYYNLPKKESFCLKKYLCYSLLVGGLVITAELSLRAYLHFVSHELGSLGWGNVNTSATFLLLSIPACYYLIIKSRIIHPLILCLVLLYIGVLLSDSDGALAFLVVYTPFLILYTYRNVYRTKRKQFSYTFAIIAIVLATASIALISVYGLKGALELLQINASSSGREPIYLEAIELFKQNPIFGYGFHYKADITNGASLMQYNFHSTLFHAMATMGILGVLAYGVYVIARLFILMRKCSPFTTIMLVAFTMFESYSMIDCSEINAIPLMTTLTTIIVVVELVTKKDRLQTALPLTTNKHNGYYF